ncbi:THRA [Lepeophtheirus salmonis]|uniref:THRA n=1 Tax=Lepeophtheirus salmonis TaxID=72036 RepID=A0A7R8HBQ5_LEPSM|nr:THRA [Lepeophtheirus salmonis]CAF2998983.1 THRA [Lepeophtheirus salmonis]
MHILPSLSPMKMCFLDSLLDIFDECHDWNPSIVESSKIKDREQPRESHELLINEILSLSESSDSFLSNADQVNFNELNSATLSEPSSQIIIRREALPRLCQICGRSSRETRILWWTMLHILCCSKTEDCIINLQTRKSCQLCRFQKCISAGMRASWVLPDGERRSKKSAMILNNNTPLLPSFDDPGGLTSLEVSFVFTINNKLRKSFFDNVNSMVIRNSDFLIDFVDYLAFPARSEYPYLRMAMSLEKIQFLLFHIHGTDSVTLSGVKFRDPELIDRAQLIYVQMLKRYFQRRYPRKSSKKFLKGIMLPSLIAEVRELSYNLNLCTS